MMYNAETEAFMRSEPRTRPRLIGLVGLAGSGKDAIAELLKEHYGVTRIAFADPVKELCLAIDPYIDYELRHHGGILDGPQVTMGRLSEMMLVDDMGERLEPGDAAWWDVAKGHPEVRRLMQAVGTEGVRRVIGDDTWINLALDHVVENWHKGLDSVITDVRFENELNAVKAEGGEIWWVRRPGSGIRTEHTSEHMARAWELVGGGREDHVIWNAAGFEDLKAEVVRAWTAGAVSPHRVE